MSGSNADRRSPPALDRCHRIFEIGDDDLAHAVHRVGGGRRPGWIRMADRLVKPVRNDPPTQTESIFPPAASLNGNCGPPLIPMNRVPSSTKLMDPKKDEESSVLFPMRRYRRVRAGE
jgi:hypothetical protein